MDLTQRLNKIASDKRLAAQGKSGCPPFAIAAFVILDSNNEVVFDPDDLPATAAVLLKAGGANQIADLVGAADPAEAVQAVLATNLTGTNNDLAFTAAAIGADGNGITVAYVDPAANDHALAIAIVGRAITITLATGVAGAITSTAALIAALNFGGLVTAANKAGNDGTGIVTAMAAAPLAGGTNATGDGSAATGSRYTNSTAGTLWINTGTPAAPVWTKLATA
jgi:hypothetical protein